MKNFISTFGRLPHTWTNMTLILVAGLMQGFGLFLFVPLLEIMNSDGGPRSSIVEYLINIFIFFGIPIELTYLLIGIVILVCAGLFCSFAQRSLLGWSQTRYVWKMRASYVRGYMESNWECLSKQATGENVNILIMTVFKSGTGLANQVEAVACALQIVVFLTFGAIISWPLLVVTFVFGPLAVFALRPLQRFAVRLGTALLEYEQQYGFLTVDYLKNMKLIKATGAEDGVFKGVDPWQEKISRTAAAKICVLAGTYYSSQILAVLLSAIIIGFAHGLFDVTSSNTLVFLIFIARSSPLLAQFQQNHHSYLSEMPAIRLVDEKLREFQSHHEREETGKTIFTSLTKGITLDNISFRYPNSEQGVLQNVNLIIPRGSMVAFVGESGAGKSTIIDLICGLRHPDQGRVLIDGLCLRDLNINTWRQRVGYVTQDVLVFNQTLRDNIIFAYPDATDEDIWDAITAAHLRQVVEELPEGLDTVLGESGIRLSGGQRQRLALARALIGKPDLLMLDEATSSLDNESEKIVQKAIDGLAHELTIVVVAHRLSTVRKADRIIVLDKGRIVETGTYRELLEAKGRFAKLHELQFT